MDPIELLDILGNENRRRILQLLSFRPFYFNEIAKRLDVGPKAVIDHLVMLERAGLIECYQEQGRRKYFRIIRKTVLEVAVSPYSYGVRAYRFEEIPKEDDNVMVPDMNLLRDELNVLMEKRRELRDLLDKVESREMEVKHLVSGLARNNSHDLLESEILVALLSGESTASDLAVKLEVPEIMVLDRLKRLKERKSVQLKDQEWSI